jgi:hypothetical protein
MRFAGKCGILGFLLGAVLGWEGCWSHGYDLDSFEDIVQCITLTGIAGAVGSIPGFIIGLAFAKSGKKGEGKGNE